MRKITIDQVKRRIGREFLNLASNLGASPWRGKPETFPAGFENWLQRKNNRLKADFPEPWRALIAEFRPQSKVVVLVHVFYVELLEEILLHLASIPVEFDLIVTNSSEFDLQIETNRLPNLRSQISLKLQNHGRDIWPMVAVVNSGILDSYELVFKIHTKKSPWRENHESFTGDGHEWKDEFLKELAGNTEIVQTILNRFAEETQLGLITASGNILNEKFWGGNVLTSQALLRRLQLDLIPHELSFAAGSIYWCRAIILQGIRALDLTQEDFEPEAGQNDGTTAHAIERILGILTLESGLEISESFQNLKQPTISSAWERFALDAERSACVRAVPFYLPQFHAFAENNLWWGKGFTEWSNVSAAEPIFRGQAQPLLPSDFGFYDLSHPDSVVSQHELADSMGIDGFMFYYYWFAGKRLMSLPLELMSSQTDSRFCIMWANENWTRKWDGGSQNILIAQDYEKVPAESFLDDVLHLLTNPNYIRVGNKPLLAVYRIAQIPDYETVIESWRIKATEAGLEGLHIVSVDVGKDMDGIDGANFESKGLDGIMEFPPHNIPWIPQNRNELTIDHRFRGNILSYQGLINQVLGRLRAGIENRRYPGVMVNFDNTARRQWQPDLWYGSNPYTFHRWTLLTAQSLLARPYDERIMFVNAWNEWAEGAVLEPSQRFGKTYLLALRNVLYS